MTTAWRIVLEQWKDTAFSGEGARLSGGRWNTMGTAVVYTSNSLSLAQLEVLVHAHKRRLLLRWAVCELDIPDEIVTSVDVSLLSQDWTNPRVWSETQQIGDRWARKNTSAVLRVPSAVSQVEFNFLLNPLHKDFRRIKIGPFRPFTFDSRLAK